MNNLIVLVTLLTFGVRLVMNGNSDTTLKNEEELKMTKEQDREYIQLGKSEMNLLKKVIGIKTHKCYYCNQTINFKKDKYSIFNKPDRLICNSILCLTEAISKDEEELK